MQTLDRHNNVGFSKNCYAENSIFVFMDIQLIDMQPPRVLKESLRVFSLSIVRISTVFSFSLRDFIELSHVRCEAIINSFN